MLRGLQKPNKTSDGQFKCRLCQRAPFKLLKWYDKHLEQEHGSFVNALESGDIAVRSLQDDQERPVEISGDVLLAVDETEPFDEELFLRSETPIEAASSRQPNIPRIFVPKSIVPFPGAGALYGSYVSPNIMRLKADPWYPFNNPDEFKLANWFIDSD